MTDLATANILARISEATARQRSIERFHRDYPVSELPLSALMPSFSWAQLHRQLTSLTNDAERVDWEILVLQSAARSLPPEMFLRELLILAWSLLDETPHAGGEEVDMT